MPPNKHGDDASETRVLLGRITGVRGLKGELSVLTYTADPADIAAYGPLCRKDGSQPLQLKIVRVSDKGVVARANGVDDRTAAEALKGRELWVERHRLPAADDGEYYHVDLIGLEAVALDGASIGKIVAVENYGAGDLLEIRLAGQKTTELIPFTDAFVPEVDLAAGRAVVILPPADDAVAAESAGD